MLTPKFVPSSEIVCSKHINDMSSFMDQGKFITYATLFARLYRLSTHEHYAYEHKSLLKPQLRSMDNNGEKYFHICINYQTRIKINSNTLL
jgi:RNA polymerase-interacting CarD/CdnL/TRCF family regulator